MPNKPATQQQLLAENEGLRVRLVQAEASLREMRSGEVDALVVSGVGGAQLFAPKDADQSFRILVGEMSEGALTMTAEGVIVYANRHFAGMLKTPLEKVIGSAVRNWIAPGSQPILQSLLEKGAGEERRAELVLAASDGTGVPVYLSVSNLPINGMSDAYCLVAFDLTEHNRIEAIAASESVARELLAAANQSRGELLCVIEDKTRAEKALAQESRRNRLLLRSASDGVHILDADGNVLEVSDAFCQMLGYSREELIGANASLWDAQWSPHEIKHKFAEQIVEKGRSVFETLHRRRDGSILDVEVSGQNLELDGKPVLFNSARDITERKRAEVEARTLSRAMEQSPASIIITDRAGMIEYVNPRFEQVTGYTRAEVVGENPRVLKSGKNAPEVYQQLWGAISVGGEWRGELCNRRKNGEMFWEFAAISGVRGENGEVERYIAVKEDITERKRAEQTQARLVAIIEATPDMVATGDINGHVLYYNRAGLRMLGFEPGMDLSTVRIPDTHPEWAAKLVMEEGIPHAIEHGTWSGETALLRRDGREIPISQVIIAHKGSDGSVEYLSTVARDITLQKEHEKRITRQNRVFAVLSGINTTIVRTRDRQELFDDACGIAVEQGKFLLAWIGVLDANGLDVTPVARAGVDEGFLDNMQLTARDDAPNRCEMVARALREKTAVVCNDIDTDPQMARWREEALRRGYRSVVVFPLQLEDKVMGLLLLYASEARVFDTEEMRLLTEIAGDISFALDHLDKQKRLNYLAYYDELTGLANRTLFLERMAQHMRSAVSGGHKLALYLIDLERFKNINDSLGRPAGDTLLRQVAEWLTYIAGDASLLARVDADHFAAVLPEVRKEGDVVRLLEKWMEAFREHPFRLNDAVFRVAIKVGVALFPDDGDNADTLFKNAEAALKKAKASGARYLFYTPTMTEMVAGKLTLENQLRQALDNEEFVLHYQPKVNLASGKLTGTEALIRWNDPRTGLVPPGRFIPILEETGLIYDVGRWALRKAIEDYLRWVAAGLPAVRIAVNVSSLQLRNRGFIEAIRQAIGLDARAPTGLELEITESLIMEDVKGTIASLGAIRAMGVSIAIDDFGTGFSSLAYLAKLPVDTLKIDRSFVIDMTAGPEGLALVSTIISLAHSLKLTVVAEGVETEEQSRLLRLLACDEMQGFLFSKPVPTEIFEARFLAPPATG